MTNIKQHVQQPKTFNAEELEARIESAQAVYKNSHAAAHRLHAPILQRFSEELIRLHKEGYELHPTFPASAGPGSYSVYLSKPEAMLKAELENVAKEVEDKYRNDIDTFNTQQQELLTEQLYAAEKKKLEDAERKKDEKLREAAATEAAKYYQGLIAKETN